MRLPSLVDINDPSQNTIRVLWDKLHPWPGGGRLFSVMIGKAAPYTGSIGARVVALRRGHAEVRMRERARIQNHLRSIHAIALANLAEFAGNLALAYSLPDDARFIVAGIALEYLKKSRGSVTAVGTCPAIDRSDRTEVEVTVEIRDEAGDLCVRATLRTLVGPKPARGPGTRGSPGPAKPGDGEVGRSFQN